VQRKHSCLSFQPIFSRPMMRTEKGEKGKAVGGKRCQQKKGKKEEVKEEGKRDIGMHDTLRCYTPSDREERNTEKSIKRRQGKGGRKKKKRERDEPRSFPGTE